MKTTIVVARYNENIEWTEQYENVIIYNKGNTAPQTSHQIVNLPNFGREGHTYYKHICDNYDNLTDFVVFLQGNPFDHSPNLHSNLKTFLNISNSHNKFDPFFQYLSETIIDCDLSACVHHPGLPLKQTYETIFGTTNNFKFKFGAGAQFIVSKVNILKWPKEFYENIVEMLNKTINPIEGFVLERFHQIIFKGCINESGMIELMKHLKKRKNENLK